MTDAIYLSAQFLNLTDEEMRRLTSKVATALKSQPITILLETSKVLEDCAVVVGKQSAEDLDPVFLLKQGGQWRVVPTVTRYDHSSFSLSDVQRGRFQKLEGWFEEKMAENYRRLAGQVRNEDTSKQVTDGYADLQERERRSESGRYELPQKPELIMRSRFAKPNTLAALALAITTTTTALAAPPSFSLARRLR